MSMKYLLVRSCLMFELLHNGEHEKLFELLHNGEHEKLFELLHNGEHEKSVGFGPLDT